MRHSKLPTASLSILLVSVILCAHAHVKNSHMQNYHSIIGLDCVTDQHIRDFHSERSPGLCARACDIVSDCQAFTMHHGHCRLFVFNRCSKNVRHCRCSRIAYVYVKRQPGLRPGALCPAGYGHNRCGVSYKLMTGLRSFDASMARCNAERGLVIMNEPTDMTKFNHLLWLATVAFPNQFGLYLGGKQDPGSPEPAGGWFWQTCRIPIDGSFWHPGEPNNVGGVEHNVFFYNRGGSLNDDTEGKYHRNTVCECVSPFDLS